MTTETLIYHKLVFEIIEDIFHIKAKGHLKLHTVLSLNKVVKDLCRKNGIDKVMVDLRETEGELSVIGMYRVAKINTPVHQNGLRTIHGAIIYRKNGDKLWKFFENAAVNRGVNIRVFTDPDTAMKWLV